MFRVVVKYFVHLASNDDKAYSALENVATMMIPLHNGTPFQHMTSIPPGNGTEECEWTRASEGVHWSGCMGKLGCTSC